MSRQSHPSDSTSTNSSVRSSKTECFLKVIGLISASTALSWNEKAIISYIYSFQADHHRCWASNATIANQLGLSLSAVEHIAANLTARGILKKIVNTGSTWVRTVNLERCQITGTDCKLYSPRSVKSTDYKIRDKKEKKYSGDLSDHLCTKKRTNTVNGSSPRKVIPFSELKKEIGGAA